MQRLFILHNNIGMVYSQDGDKEMAKQHWEKAVEIMDNIPQAQRDDKDNQVPVTLPWS